MTMKSKTPCRDALKHLALGLRWWRYRLVRSVSDRVARWVAREGGSLLVVHRQCGDLNEASEACEDVKHLFGGLLAGAMFIAFLWVVMSL